MGIGASLVIFAVGAVLRFAVTVHSSGFNISKVGDILMIVAAVGFVLSLVFWSSWGGFGNSTNRRRETTVDSPSGVTKTTTEEHSY